MRRLIFLWFLASLTILIGMLLVAITWSGPNAFRTMGKHFARGLLVYAARQAAWAWETKGREGLEEFQRSSLPSAESRGAFYNEQGQELTGGQIPPQLQHFAQKVSQTGDPEMEVFAGMARFAVRVQGPSGSAYTLAFQSPTNQFIWSLIDWQAWFMRVLFVVAVGVLVCSWLATKFSTPLADLRTQTRRFASGDLSARSTRGLALHIPEIEALASDFDHMAERIESLVRSQRHLLHFVSHELRTPLTRIQLAISLAQREPQSRATLDRISAEGDRLNDLIDQILRYSQLESAEQKPAMQPIDWQDFLDSITADASFEANAQGKEVILRHVDGGRFTGDRDLLRSAFENVIRNAIRHSPPGASVEVEQRTLPAPGGWDVLIHDAGAGIAEDQLGRIFEPFFRAAPTQPQPAAQGAKPSGYGLGLAIAKQVAMLHGATLQAQNRKGGGLTVQFRFPRQPAA